MLTPVEGCLVRMVSGHERVGMVTGIRSQEGMAQVSVRWTGSSSVQWLSPLELVTGFGLRAVVVDVPRSRTRRSLGTGEIVEKRKIGGRFQHLVEFYDAGKRVWLPYENLRLVRGTRQRFLLGQPDAEGDPERFRLRALACAIQTWHENTGAMSRLNIDPLPHQIYLVHHILKSGNLNWLIADDVGLGKTIEVGMLLSALRQRGSLRRVLLVTPAGLVRQWKEEMHYKFGLSGFRIYGEDFFINDDRDWKLYDYVIGSLDRLKQSSHLNSLMQAGTWDLIVFDEAHRLSRSQFGMKLEASDRFQLAKKLRTLTDSVLLLSATPHQGKQDKFQALLELIRPEWRDQIQTLSMNPSLLAAMVIRNNKADVTDVDGNFVFRGKITKAITVPAEPEAMRFDQALQNYLRKGYDAGDAAGVTGKAIGFVMTVYRKLAASSVAAIESALQRRQDRLRGAQKGGSANPEIQDEDERYQGESEERLTTSSAEFFAGEALMLNELLQLAGKLRMADGKLRAFMDNLLSQVLHSHSQEKILIFSEYRATQEYICLALCERFGSEAVSLIHGSMEHAERSASITRFESTGQFLISTEAGAEGINLQRNCHILVNFDLPWNPMRLVQRVGRLYRYGQKHPVIVFNMHAPQTLDAEIMITLYERVDQVVSDMACLGGEFSEGLKDEIMGEVADLLDVESILKEAMQTGVRRTTARIEEALDKAKGSALRQRELFDHVTGFRPEDAKGELKLTREHVRSFVTGMCAQLDIAVKEETHDGAVALLRLPEALKQRLRMRSSLLKIAFDRKHITADAGTVMMDFETPFFRFLHDEARKPGSGGLHACTEGLEGDALFVFMLRWQNDQGRRVRQEFAAILAKEYGETTTNTAAIGNWLLHRQPDSNATGSRVQAEKLLLHASQAADLRLGQVASDDIHPESSQLVSCAWISPHGQA